MRALPADAGGGTSSEDSSGSVAGQMRDGRVSTDILETDGVGYRVAGILETGGNEDGIIYATVDDIVALAGDRGPDVIEFASQADDGHLEALRRCDQRRRTGRERTSAYPG